MGFSGGVAPKRGVCGSPPDSKSPFWLGRGYGGFLKKEFLTASEEKGIGWTRSFGRLRTGLQPPEGNQGSLHLPERGTAITLELMAATEGGTLGATTEGLTAFVEKKSLNSKKEVLFIRLGLARP